MGTYHTHFLSPMCAIKSCSSTLVLVQFRHLVHLPLTCGPSPHCITYNHTPSLFSHFFIFNSFECTKSSYSFQCTNYCSQVMLTEIHTLSALTFILKAESIEQLSIVLHVIRRIICQHNSWNQKHRKPLHNPPWPTCRA